MKYPFVISRRQNQIYLDTLRDEVMTRTCGEVDTYVSRS